MVARSRISSPNPLRVASPVTDHSGCCPLVPLVRARQVCEFGDDMWRPVAVVSRQPCDVSDDGLPRIRGRTDWQRGLEHYLVSRALRLGSSGSLAAMRSVMPVDFLAARDTSRVEAGTRNGLNGSVTSPMRSS